MTQPPQLIFVRPGSTGLVLLTLLFSVVSPRCASAAPANQSKAGPSAKTVSTTATGILEIPKSVFVVPASAQEGRDPFFPESTRMYVVAVTNTQVRLPTAELVLKILSGTPASPLASINNHTFGVGEEADVLTPTGRVRVRCLEINLNDEAVLVEVGGERRELRFPKRK